MASTSFETGLINAIVVPAHPEQPWKVGRIVHISCDGPYISGLIYSDEKELHRFANIETDVKIRGLAIDHPGLNLFNVRALQKQSESKQPEHKES